MSPEKQGIIQKRYNDIIVGSYYHMQVRAPPMQMSDLHHRELVSDPIFFAESNELRSNTYNVNSSGPKRESRPMYIGPDGRLHYKYDMGDAHQNRMQAIFRNKSVDGRSSPSPPPRASGAAL